jgi:hypothetical protein
LLGRKYDFQLKKYKSVWKGKNNNL